MAADTEAGATTDRAQGTTAGLSHQSLQLTRRSALLSLQTSPPLSQHPKQSKHPKLRLSKRLQPSFLPPPKQSPPQSRAQKPHKAQSRARRFLDPLVDQSPWTCPCLHQSLCLRCRSPCRFLQ